MKLLIFIILFSITSVASASAYLGLNYGYGRYTSEATDKYKLNQKGPTYGGFFGFGKEFVGVEGFYQKLDTSGKIKHEGESYDLKSGASGVGAAFRLSFNAFYLRAGIGRYTMNQSVNASDATNRRAIEQLYDVQNDVSKNGFLFGLGLHKRIGGVVTFLDFTRHQVSSIGNYDTLSFGLSFNLPESFFDFAKF